MPAEENHELGRDGVFLFKRWLEATTYLDLPWNAYGSGALCEIKHMDGVKEYDLAGMFLTDGMPPVVVECKRYKYVGGQAAEFEEFLAIAYGSSVWDRTNGMREKNRNFIWATTHPFGQSNWSQLTTASNIEAAVGKHSRYAGDDPFDSSLAESLSQRIWLLVLSEKQEQIMLTPKEVLKVWKVLKRKQDQS
ncbi:hypothetical protein ACIQXM_17930 [Arthrobacter sp. NPDC097144]|uniref:hypothetical protein n=1 Tax=Arthrobacter sp. NPDC097144 TaxID=3363946 RepID=UPI0037FD9578